MIGKTGSTQAREAFGVGAKSPLHFYEKVIKVKADVAALHIFFFGINDAASGGVKSGQGRPVLGAQRRALFHAGVEQLGVTVSYRPFANALALVAQ